MRWGIRRGGGGAEPERALVEDPNDELCRICWQGVRHLVFTLVSAPSVRSDVSQQPTVQTGTRNAARGSAWSGRGGAGKEPCCGVALFLLAGAAPRPSARAVHAASASQPCALADWEIIRCSALPGLPYVYVTACQIDTLLSSVMPAGGQAQPASHEHSNTHTQAQAPTAWQHARPPERSGRPPQGEVVCCETCPAVMHAECTRLPAIPSADWHCPACACAACGHAGFGPRADLGAAAGQVLPAGLLRLRGLLRMRWCCASAVRPASSQLRRARPACKVECLLGADTVGGAHGGAPPRCWRAQAPQAPAALRRAAANALRELRLLHAHARAPPQVLWVEPVVGEGGEPPAWSGPEFAGGRAPRVALPAPDFDELVGTHPHTLEFALHAPRAAGPKQPCERGWIRDVSRAGLPPTLPAAYIAQPLCFSAPSGQRATQVL